MTKILLVSEDYIKTNSALNDNLWGKTLLPAIREAQEMGLQTIIGSCLYKVLLSMVGDGSIVAVENAAYKTLLDEYVLPYMLYKTQANVVPLIAAKLGNIGTVYSTDEYVQSLSNAGNDQLSHYYEYRTDFYTRRLQEFLINNRELYPELKECDCKNIKANLKSAASTDWFLGGARSKKIK